MGPVDENYYFDPSMQLQQNLAEKVKPIRPSPEDAKIAEEKLKKKGLIAGPEAARLDKKKSQEKTKKQQKKADAEEKGDQPSNPF